MVILNHLNRALSGEYLNPLMTHLVGEQMLLWDPLARLKINPRYFEIRFPLLVFVIGLHLTLLFLQKLMNVVDPQSISRFFLAPL